MGCNTSKETSQPVENNKENEKESAENQENANHVEAANDKSGGGDTTTDPEEDKAATRIQAVYRGHKTRKSMKQGDIPNKDCNKSAEEQNKMAATSEEEPTKEQLEADFRPDDKELCDAATRIQASFRGHMSRKQVPLQDDKDIQELTKKVAEELDIDLTDPELHKAATKIQASFRGHKVRKDTDADGEN